MTRKCSHCGNNGHNSRTCPNRGGGAGGGSLGGGGGLKLFGVRLTDGPIRKSASMGNLVAMNLNHNLNHNVDEGYQSDGFVQASSSNQARERKKGVPWTEEEHRMFLVGLQKLGKGDWRGIARKYVISRTPTQVASHAQKYFIRQTNVTRRKRRSSLFDMIPESDSGTMMMGGEENTADHMNENSAEHQMHRLGHPTCENTTQNLMLSTNQIAQNQLQSPTVLNPLFGQGTGAETNNRMMVPSTPASDQECESLPSSNQEEDEATFSQARVPIACAVPVMFPGFIQPMFPYPFPVWGTGYRPNTTELPPNCNVVKPRAQVLTTPLNIEDAGISKLSIGDTPARIEPSDLSLKLMNRPSSQSAFHANPPVSSSSLGSSSNAIHVN